MRRMWIAAPMLAALAATVPAALAQTGPAAPPKAAEPLVVLTASSLSEALAKLAMGGREDFVGKNGGTETAMFVQKDKDRKGQAEVHRDSDDYHFVLEGSAAYTLGGTLDAAKETAPGEWRGGGISGGRTVELKKGDLIFVPRGTPHQRNMEGHEATFMIIKVYADPTPKVSPAK